MPATADVGPVLYVPIQSLGFGLRLPLVGPNAEELFRGMLGVRKVDVPVVAAELRGRANPLKDKAIIAALDLHEEIDRSLGRARRHWCVWRDPAR